MPGFHHSVAVVKLCCSVKLRNKIPFRYTHKQQKDTQRQQCTETANGNDETATEDGNGKVETGHNKH